MRRRWWSSLRKHTANVRDGLDEIRRIIEALVESRDARRDGFSRVMSKAMQQSLGSDADEVLKVLTKHEIPRHLANGALEIVPKIVAPASCRRFCLFRQAAKIAGKMPALQILRRGLRFIFPVRRRGFAAATGTAPQANQKPGGKH